MEMVDIAKRPEHQRLPPLGTTPWLVYTHGHEEASSEQTFCDVLTSDPKKYYLKSIPELHNKSIWACSHGWLLLLDLDLDDFCFSLWNPISLETIKLPPLKLIPDYFISIIMLSSPPSDVHSTVFLFDRSHRKIIYCQLGDQQWTQYDYAKELGNIMGTKCEEGYFDIAVSCNGKIYTKAFRKMVVIEFDDSNIHMRSLEIEVPDTKLNVTYWKPDLFESCGELFLVYQTYRGIKCGEVSSIEVHRLDFSRMVWIRVESLKDGALFLGEDCTTFCQVTDSRIKGSHIYFTMHEDESLYSFNMEDGSILVTMPCKDLQTPWKSPLWVMPDLRLTNIHAEDHKHGINSEEEKEENKKVHMVVKENEDEKYVEAERKLEGSHWSDLNRDCLTSISHHLVLVDYLHFRAICKVCRLAAPLTQWTTASTLLETKPLPLSPCLVFFKNDNGICNFIDSKYGEMYCINIPELLLCTTICYSKDGWLLMRKGKEDIFFFNPFTKTLGQFPKMSEMFTPTTGIGCSSSPNSSDCVVVWIFNMYKRVLISFIRAWENEWNHIGYENNMDFTPNDNSPVFLDGAFYFLGQSGNLGIFELNDDGHVWKVLAEPQAPCDSFHHNFLMECDGDLLSVFVGHLGKWVKVFRLNHSKMVWVEVKSLGNCMLFVSYSSSFSSVARTPGMENKIYFPRLRGESIVFYSLETTKFHTLGSKDFMDDYNDTKEYICCGWIEPSWF